MYSPSSSFPSSSSSMTRSSLTSPQSPSTTGSNSSTEMVTDFTPYRGLRPAKVVTNQDMPFSLRMLSRSPREILEKKAEMVKVGKADTANVDEQAVENEIRVKLFYLEMIRRLKEGSGVRKAEEVSTLVLGIKDMKDKIEQAKTLIKSGEEQQEMMMWQVVEARQELANQKMAMSDSMEVQARTVKNCQAMLMTYQTQLASAQARLATPEVGVDIAGQAASSCTQFSSLFCLSGQVDQLCGGEQGSKWVVDRLVMGQHQERSLVRTEPNLPQDLTKHITNINCRKVILALAAVDSQARVELLKQTKEEIDLILGLEGGKEFVTELVKME